MDQQYIIKNGTVVLPEKEEIQQADILVEDGKISAIAPDINKKNIKTIDAQGCHILPGLVDMHVHLRDPGQEYKEDLLSGAQAAAAGGITSLACMPNTNPAVDSPELVRYIKDKSRQTSSVNIYPIGSITKGLNGEELSEMGLMHREGAVTFSDDGKYLLNSEVMKNALLYAKSFGINLISHSEDPYLSEDGEMNEGYYATVLGLKGIPAVSEEIAVSRDILLAENYGPVHIAHISTKGSVNLVREAKKRGVPVTCETAPHYLWFTEEDLVSYNTNFKMKPPLRKKEDQRALIEGLQDGTIDAIATDHAPHSIDEKNCEFKKAAFGVTGLETLLCACLTKLYFEEKMDLPKIVRKLTTNPAQILKLNKGTLTPGQDADLVIVDMNKSKKIKESNFKSKASNSPFLGIKLKGKIVYTICSGKIVYQNNHL